MSSADENPCRPPATDQRANDLVQPSVNGPVMVTGALELHDLYDIRRINSRKKVIVIRPRQIVAGLFLVIAVYMSFRFLMTVRTFDSFLSVVHHVRYFLLIFGLLSVFYWRNHRRSMASFNAGTGIFELRKFSIADEGLGVESETLSAMHKWSGFEHYVVAPDGVVVAVSGGVSGVFYFPTRWFETVTQRDQAIAIIAANLPSIHSDSDNANAVVKTSSQE